MSTSGIQLEAGGLLPARSKTDETTEHVVARSYRHPALGARPVVRLASDRLGQAEDLAMEFLGFESPEVSPPIGVQQRRSLGFAAWALVNDPDNAHFALDLVKRMKAAARKARSKPGHAWDTYTAMAQELGRSAPHFLPPYWEEVGRTFKDLGNQTYAGRALNKSLEAERVHALESDRERRRDVVLEFVLSGCLAGKALSEYAADLQHQYPAEEAFSIFRDLCVRRTRGGMAPWAAMPKDFLKIAKAARLDADQELEQWLEEIIEAPAMGRASNQYWKACSKHCQRIVARNPAFAVALLRHTQPAEWYYGESKVFPWLDLLEKWGVLEFLWEDEHQGAPPLGEPVAVWFGRIVREEVPAPKRVLEMLEKLTPRLKQEKTPLPLAITNRYGGGNIDVDVLEASLALGIPIADPPENVSVAFDGWLTGDVDHAYRNQDIVHSSKEERFKGVVLQAMDEALACRGGSRRRVWYGPEVEQRPFPLAAGDRPGIKELWHYHTSSVLDQLEQSGLASFEAARTRLELTLWPETLKLFPDLAERIHALDPVAMLQQTLQAGVFDEYGFPAFEEAVDQNQLQVKADRWGHSNISLTFPHLVVSDKSHAHVIRGDGTISKHELRLPKKSQLMGVAVIADDLAVVYRDATWNRFFYWMRDPSQTYSYDLYGYASTMRVATVLEDGSVFMGKHAVRPGDKQLPESESYFHDGERFWQVSNEWDDRSEHLNTKVRELDPRTGKTIRESVPAWFEEIESGAVEWGLSQLLSAPAGAEQSPLGTKDGLLGWKTVRRRDGSSYGEGIDGRRWEKPLLGESGVAEPPIGLLRQPGSNAYLPVSTRGTGQIGVYRLWDPTGSTVVAALQDFGSDYAGGQVCLLPMHFWHFMKPRHEASSKKLRSTSHKQCETLLKAAAKDHEARAEQGRKTRAQKGGKKKDDAQPALANLLPAVKKFLPQAPERMVLGIARLVEKAASEAAAFTKLRDKTNADSQKESTQTSLVMNRRSDTAAQKWSLDSFHIYGDQQQTSVSQHLIEAAAFLKGESKGGQLPRTDLLWFPMLEDLPLRCWQTFWEVAAAKMGQKDPSDLPWLEFLELWHELGIAELPGQFATMSGYPEGAKKRTYGYDVDVESGAAFTLENGDDLFIVIESNEYDQLPFQFLRYSTAKNPGNPPGYKTKDVRKIKHKYDAKQIKAFLDAARSCDDLPLPSKDELAEVARNLSASPAEIGLVWIGGLNVTSYYGNNFLPPDLRKTLGWKVSDASAARQALTNLEEPVLTALYSSVVSPSLTAPFADDRGPVLRSIENVWQAKMPKRLPVDAGLQKRLAALAKISRWHRVDQNELLTVAAESARHPLLQPRDLEIRVVEEHGHSSLALVPKQKNQPAIDDALLRQIVQLVAVVHGETAAGHEVRPHLPDLVKQTTRLLDSPKTLLALRDITFYEYGSNPVKPSDWISKYVGKTTRRGKETVAHFDERLISAGAYGGSSALVAFRPAELKDNSDMARLRGIRALELGNAHDSADAGLLELVAVIKSPGFQKLADAMVPQETPDGQWPQNPIHTAPAVVEGVQEQFSLGEDAAVLYAQLLALPDPTTANVRTWNGWTAARLKKASAELVQQELVLDAKRARAGRTVFLPGEWAELKTPWLPVETWKLRHLAELDLEVDDPYPASGPMVLRPFEDVFAAAWQRVLEGDKPRYEEVKRKRKGKR